MLRALRLCSNNTGGLLFQVTTATPSQASRQLGPPPPTAQQDPQYLSSPVWPQKMSGLDPALQSLLDISYTGCNLASMFYGAYVIIAVTNIHHLIQKGSKFLLAYTILLLCITTIYMGVAVNYSQKQIIDDPTSPDLLSVWPQIVVNATYSINNWLTDAYLLYRCYIIWSETYYILILPCLIYLGSVACAIALLVFAANPGAMYSSHTVQVFGTANWTLSLSLNVIVTVLIAGRLIFYRSRLRQVLGPNHGKVYTTIIAITVESAALYAVFELMALVAFLTNSPTENVFFPMLGNVQVIAPNLIIYRIAKGISYTSENSGDTIRTDIEFASSKITRPAIVTTIGGSTTQVGSGYPYSANSDFKSTRSNSSKGNESREVIRD